MSKVEASMMSAVFGRYEERRCVMKDRKLKKTRFDKSYKPEPPTELPNVPAPKPSEYGALRNCRCIVIIRESKDL